MKTSLGIWALGPMITRFVPMGYQPEHTNEGTATKVRRAVEGLGDLARHGQVLVLLLADPPDGVGDVHATSRRVAPVGATAVEHLAVVEQQAAAPHLDLSAGHRRRLVDVDRLDATVGDVRPGERRVQRAIERQVGEVAPGADEQARILGACDPRPEHGPRAGEVGRRHGWAS